MPDFISHIKIKNTALILVLVILLSGCERPTSTQSLDPDSFRLGVTVTYHPSSGEGAAIINIEYPAFLSTDSGLDLGRGDSIVITSGVHSTAITSVPMGFTRQLVNIDPISPLKMEFFRSNDVLQKYEMSIDESLVPSIETDSTTLDSSTKSVNATISYGIRTPYELVGGTSFNYGALPTRCATEERIVELEYGSLLTDYYFGLDRPVGFSLDEITLNPNIDAAFLVYREKEKLDSAEYLSCETSLFSYIELGKGSSFVTYTEEGDMDGNMKAVLLSEPVSIQVENTAIELLEN